MDLKKNKFFIDKKSNLETNDKEFITNKIYLKLK